MTHIRVCQWAGSSLIQVTVWRQTNLLIIRTNFNEIWIKLFSVKEMRSVDNTHFVSQLEGVNLVVAYYRVWTLSQCRRRPNSGYRTLWIPGWRESPAATQYTNLLLRVRLSASLATSTAQITTQGSHRTRHRDTGLAAAPDLYRDGELSTRDGRGGARHSRSSKLSGHHWLRTQDNNNPKTKQLPF